MFERFTDSAREVIVLSQKESRALQHDYIGTEHLLLGLLREEHSLAAQVLSSLDLTFSGVQAQVERIVGRGDGVPPGEIPFTRHATKTLDLAVGEALSLGHTDVGAEHILLALAHDNEGVACRVLRHFGADAETIRNRLIVMLSEQGPHEPASPAVRPPPGVRGPNWEYWVERTPDAGALSIDSLNELGSEGWELAGVVPDTAGVALVFKRRL